MQLIQVPVFYYNILLFLLLRVHKCAHHKTNLVFRDDRERIATWRGERTAT